MVGPHWLLTEETKDVVCDPFEKYYKLAIPIQITQNESTAICKEKLNNSVIPYPDSDEAFLKYVTWYKKITNEVCHFIWTPLSDEETERKFLLRQECQW